MTVEGSTEKNAQAIGVHAASGAVSGAVSGAGVGAGVGAGASGGAVGGCDSMNTIHSIILRKLGTTCETLGEDTEANNPIPLYFTLVTQKGKPLNGNIITNSSLQHSWLLDCYFKSPYH